MADPTPPQRPLESFERSSIERAGLWSPHDARPWLLLAATNLAPGGSDVRVIEGLKLSYFTGPSQPAFTPLRLAVVTRSHAANDPDIEQFARQDLQTIFARFPDLRPAVAQAYKSASPDGKKFLGGALSELDPNFLRTLGGAASPPLIGR